MKVIKARIQISFYQFFKIKKYLIMKVIQKY